MLPLSKTGDIYFDPALTYRFRCLDFDIGYLSYCYKESSSGHYIQYLCEGAYHNDAKYYEPDSKWRNSVLWEIIPCPDDEGPYFLLRNKGLDYGYLSVTKDKSASGFYLDHLYSNNYDHEKQLYERGGKNRDRVLWLIEGTEKENVYKLFNKAFQGYMTYTCQKAKSGYYVQVLTGENFEDDKEKYEKGGKWERSVLWEIKPASKYKN